MFRILVVSVFPVAGLGLLLQPSAESPHTRSGGQDRTELQAAASTAGYASEAEGFPDHDPRHRPPETATELFELSQDYPDEYDASAELEWESIDFRTHPDEYMDAVLRYCLEGNVAIDFRVQENAVRKWYHAPWLHDDGDPCGNGREYLHGLTRERSTPVDEIHRLQDVPLENWAVGFYNDRGGYTIGKVWLTDSGEPDPTEANFPEGTVSFKLLFTDGPVEKVPFLESSFEWTANIYSKKPYKKENGQRVCETTTREDRTVRLLQVDIAVKDQRADESGWVLGTFMYDSSAAGEAPWGRLVPVGLSWGNDPGVSEMMNREGSFENPSLTQTWLNSDLIEVPDQDYADKEAYVRFHGLGGRLNGPVDHPISSCVSCHAQAAVTDGGFPMDLSPFTINRPDFTESDLQRWFSNVGPGANERQFDGKTFTTLDYSLQLAAGIRNYYFHKANAGGVVEALSLEAAAEPEPALPTVTRGDE